jgi:cysteine desulfurase / selenocysteine lyase
MIRPPLDPKHFDFGDHLWIMHCAKGPAPRTAVNAAEALLAKELHPWDLDLSAEWAGIPIGLRAEAARAIGGSPEDITISTSTSAGLVALAQGIPFRAGDEVLAPLGEFPSNVWPWKALAARGVSFREVPIWEGQCSGSQALASSPPNSKDDFEGRLLDAIGPRTRLLAVSWVRFQDGLKLDLDRLGQACRARDVIFVVDGIQGAGTHLPSLRWVDAFACGGQKGCLGPQGHGFLWTAPALREVMIPQGSWLSVEEGSDLARTVTDFEREWLKDGRRHECGSVSLLGSVLLKASLQTLNAAGISTITAHADRLQAELLGRLRGIPAWSPEADRLEMLRNAGRLGPLLCLYHQNKDAEFLHQCLKKAQGGGIHATAREGYLRIALHGWHTSQDLDRIEGWLNETDS